MLNTAVISRHFFLFTREINADRSLLGLGFSAKTSLPVACYCPLENAGLGIKSLLKSPHFDGVKVWLVKKKKVCWVAEKKNVLLLLGYKVLSREGRAQP